MTKCTICGNSHYEAFAFKGGHICEECLAFFKSEASNEPPVRGND